MEPARGELAQLEERLGYRFRQSELLERALTHSSSVPELRAESVADSAQAAPSIQDNETLEFLGDAVLELLAREYLLESFPDWSEGQLSKGRAWIVNANSLQNAARRIKVGEYLRLGRGEEKSGGREKSALLADAFEAIVAAVYLDAGLAPTREMLKRLLFAQALEERGERIADSDRKSALQEFLQAQGRPPAEYRLTGETGPDHQKTFQVEVWVKGERMAGGEGSTKKEAEQRAAQTALELLERVEASELKD
jgi:ribonuclease-3